MQKMKEIYTKTTTTTTTTTTTMTTTTTTTTATAGAKLPWAIAHLVDYLTVHRQRDACLTFHGLCNISTRNSSRCYCPVTPRSDSAQAFDIAAH